MLQFSSHFPNVSSQRSCLILISQFVLTMPHCFVIGIHIPPQQSHIFSHFSNEASPSLLFIIVELHFTRHTLPHYCTLLTFLCSILPPQTHNSIMMFTILSQVPLQCSTSYHNCSSDHNVPLLYHNVLLCHHDAPIGPSQCPSLSFKCHTIPLKCPQSHHNGPLSPHSGHLNHHFVSCFITILQCPITVLYCPYSMSLFTIARSTFTSQ